MVTSTSTTFTITPTPVSYNISPNLKHPVFAENLERVEGVEAALNYLYRKGLNVLDEYGRDVYDVAFK